MNCGTLARSVLERAKERAHILRGLVKCLADIDELIMAHGLIFYLVYQYKSEVTYMHLIFSRVFPNTIYTFILGLVFSIFFVMEYTQSIKQYF
jgi:hypothetical protein